MPIVALADAKAQLNFRAGYVTDDVELQGFIDAATPIVEDIAGVILPRTITAETYDGGGPVIALRSVPVLSVTSVVEYLGTSAYTLTSQPQGAASPNNYGYELVDPLRGILGRRGIAGDLTPFLGGQRGVVVSYVAGYQTVPANVRLGALRLVQHLWQNSQNGMGGTGGLPPFNPGMEMPSTMVAGYAVPNDVVQILVATPTSPRRLVGIA